MEEELKDLAVRLFGRERLDRAPTEKHWCLSAVDNYGDRSSGPWFKYAEDKDWQCELCYEDRYLSQYGEKYLLSGAGMLALFDRLQRTSMDAVKIVCTGYDPIEVKLQSPGWHALGAGATLPEAFVRAAIAALNCAEV